MGLQELLTVDVFGEELNLNDLDEAIDLFEDAAHSNLNSRIRKGAVDHVLSVGHMVMSGRLMDNRKNLERLIKLAALDEAPLAKGLERHRLLHAGERLDDITEVHRLVGRAKDVVEAALRRSPEERHLPPLEADQLAVAGAGPLTLRAASAGLRSDT